MHGTTRLFYEYYTFSHFKFVLLTCVMPHRGITHFKRTNLKMLLIKLLHLNQKNNTKNHYQ